MYDGDAFMEHSLFTSELVVVIYEGLYFDLAQGQMNGAPNETSELVVCWCNKL